MIAFLGLGSNLGNRLVNLLAAIENIRRDIGVIQTQSSIYESEAWGYTSNTDFYNMVVSVDTRLAVDELLKVCQQIELKAGRKFNENTNKYNDRPIDIDILFYDAIKFNSKDLIVPHPRIAERKFTLLPMNEIAPDWEHPVLNKKIHELLTSCQDNSTINRLSM